MMYVRTTLLVDGAQAVHVAELEDLGGICHMHRLIAITPAGPRPAEIQQKIVPHPDTYGDYPDIKAEYITREEFESLI